MTSFQVTWGGQNAPAMGKVFARKRNKDSGSKKLNLDKLEGSEKSAKQKPKPNKKQDQSTTTKINSKKSTQSSEISLVKKAPIISNNKKEKQNSAIKTGNNKEKPPPNNSETSTDKKPFLKRSKLFNTNNDTGQAFVRRKNKKDKALNINDNTGSNASSNKQHSLFSEKHKNVYIKANVKGKATEEKVFSGGKSFKDLAIHRHLISNLEKNNLSLLTSIQEKSIPSVLSGKNVLIRSQTGSGKTLTFVVPIIDALLNLQPKLQRSDGLQAIIVVPNRELALQIHEVINKLNTFQWIVAGHLCGGENRKTEKDRLRKGVHILVGTPGRLLDHILHTEAFNAKNVRCLVLDEADHLLNMGFMKDITRLVEEIDNHKKRTSYDPMALLRGQNNNITKFDTSDNTLEESFKEASDLAPLKNPKSTDKQIILLSATLTRGILDLTNFLMKDHVYIDTLDQPSITEDSQLIIPKSVKQEYLITFVKHRLVTLAAFLIAKSKERGKTFVFMATTQMVDFHYDLFTQYLLKMPKDRNKLKIGDVVLMEDLDLDELNNSDEDEEMLDIELFKLHGNMDQSERKNVFNKFRKCQKGVLICSDVAARGIDVTEADCIVQYTAPQSNDDYLHRVGRTGRAGKSGSSLIFLTHEEQDYISKLREQNVFVQESKKNYLTDLTDYMMEPDSEKAILALQKRFETALNQDKELHRKACFAYSSWSRFYSSYSREMKEVFDMRKCNLGHYCTSFGLKETPSQIGKVVRGQVEKTEPKRLNKKLANHEDNQELTAKPRKRPIKALSLVTSEFSSGLEPAKKRKKVKNDS